MLPTHIVKHIQDYCKANASEAIVKKYARYFKEGYDAYGLTAELQAELVNQLVTEQNVTLPNVLEASHQLVQHGKYEETSIAILLLLKFKKQFTVDTFSHVEQWFDEGINNWAHTDSISGDVIAHFIQKGIISYQNLSHWRTSSRPFKRRAVPVTLIKVLKLTNDYEPLLEFIDPLMMDPDRVVHQGLGWFLREAWKKQHEPIEGFLMQWKNEAPRLIFQYATEKMTPDYKLRFRKGKP
ncbi:MAG TPA: DNA alkylation repair protein [Tenuifilaceae bacterium]|nr:DNA alkylation repair protein [Tenuifilaceae bacterium]HQB77693.1 DNA alkylation repair protein [Tenuifilaceae bacterium]